MRADGLLYDPSYGTTPTAVDFLESLEPAPGVGWQFTTSAARQLFGLALLPPNPTGISCPH